LFGSAAGPQPSCGSEYDFEPGVDIDNGGYVCTSISQSGQCTAQQLICNTQQHLNTGFDPGHYYSDWTSDYLNGGMNGFCHEYSPPSSCPSYAFVPKSDVQPYFDIATNYGFANYMFQTNEGPSFEAHQFLFTGTSAPVAPNDPRADYHWDFVKDNVGFDHSGCPYTGRTKPGWIEPDRTPIQDPLNSECYTHDSLVTGASYCGTQNCDKDVSWKYYTPTEGIIWDAPAGIPEVCYGENDAVDNQPNRCGYNNGHQAEWGHVALPNQGGYDSAPILDDIANCNLQKISWVIPDFQWSDHPDVPLSTSLPYGPSWVGDIIDALGKSYQNGCDYWGTHPSDNPQPTAIFVVWDDWGGFYDHVQPPNVWTGSSLGDNKWSCNAPNQWGCGYTYGFRVPFFVVSEYTGTSSNGYSGYISGACGGTGQPSCPNKTPIYQHDFGSILRYTEYNFNMSFIDQATDNGYADRNAIDAVNGNIPLSDFFPLWTGPGSTGRPFVNISTPYSASFFRTYYTTKLPDGSYPQPTGPDTE
jgi:hypothetical protein